MNFWFKKIAFWTFVLIIEKSYIVVLTIENVNRTGDKAQIVRRWCWLAVDFKISPIVPVIVIELLKALSFFKIVIF